MNKKYIIPFLIIAFLLPSSLAFADYGERRDFHRDFHGEHVIHRLGPGYISLMVGTMALLYNEGLFYRYTPAGYVVVAPPMGAVIPMMPPGYTMVIQNGVPYYCAGYTYYTQTPNGYMVVAPPVMPAMPQSAPPPYVAAPPVAAAPVAASVNTVNAPAQTEESKRDVYDIYIPNGNGSYTSVTLRKTEKGFLGPQGEFYADHPTVDQLRERYIKK